MTYVAKITDGSDVDLGELKIFLLDAQELEHSQGNLWDHLKGTHDILRNWGMPNSLCVGGLIHSVYSTAYYQNAYTSISNRANIRRLAGYHAETLSFLFSQLDRSLLWQAIKKESLPFVNYSISVL